MILRLLALILAAHAAGAQQLQLDALRWRNLGPNRGGRSLAAAGSDARPLEYYFGAVGGGLWKTTNGGTTWAPVTDGQVRSSSVGALAVSPSNPDIVYIGMGETELRGNIMQGDGMYKSTDAGKAWKHIGLADTQSISRVRVHPTNPNLVFAAALGHPYGPNEERGVYKSTDGGATWKKVLYRNDHCGAIDLTMDPSDPRILFASIWDVYRKPWMLSSGGPGSGLFKSTDAGETWTEITRATGMPSGVIGKINVSISPADPKRVFAMVEADDGGLFVSNDSGVSWTRVNEERKIRQRAFYFSRIEADPKNRDSVYAMNVEFYRSTDGGKTFQTIRTPHADHHDLWVSRTDPKRMISAHDGGATVSTDGGRTWTGVRIPTAQFYHVVTTNEIPYHVCGPQQDNSSACVPSDGGPSLRDPRSPAADWLYAAGAGEAGYVAPDPKDPNIFYGGDQAGVIVRYDRRTGGTRNIHVYPLFFSGMPASALPDRWQWTFPIVFSPVDPRILYTSSQHLWKTTNDGQTWQKISPDLTRNDPATLGDSGGPITKDQNGPEIYGTIFTIAPSRHDVNTIWTGSDDGLVQVTRDGGKTWQNVTPTGIGEFNRVSIIEASPSKPGGAYVAAKRYQMDDRRPYIFKTADYGKTWTKIVNGIPETDFVHAVREDPKKPGLLYAGTEHGVYVSFDDGAQWRPLSLNLPDTQVSNMVVEKNDLVIATHGRGFWILDDIGALRQFTPSILGKDLHLFAPRPAVRSLSPAIIDYSLRSAARSLSIEILSPTGQVVRTFDSRAATQRAPSDADDEDAAPVARAPGAKAGVNRFRWDLRYPGPVTFPGIVLRGAAPEQGPLAPPGKYTVRVKADGATESQPLVIERDPRQRAITDAELEEQFKLAIQIRDRTSAAHSAVLQIRAIREQVDQRAAAASDPAISTRANTIKSKLAEVEGDLFQTKNRSPRDTLNYPIKLNNQLAVLQRYVDTGDWRPTDSDYAVFKELDAKLNGILARLRAVLADDIAKLNEALSAKRLDAIKFP